MTNGTMDAKRYLRKWIMMFLSLCFSGGTPQFQLVTPSYYDQNMQVMMGNGRGLGTPVRLVSPAHILVNPATGQQGMTPLEMSRFVCVCFQHCIIHVAEWLES